MLRLKHAAKDFVYSLTLMVWTREVLCTHSVSGRQSNAHKGVIDAKPQLDAEKVESICSKLIPLLITTFSQLMTKPCGVTRFKYPIYSIKYFERTLRLHRYFS